MHLLRGQHGGQCQRQLHPGAQGWVQGHPLLLEHPLWLCHRSLLLDGDPCWQAVAPPPMELWLLLLLLWGAGTQDQETHHYGREH